MSDFKGQMERYDPKPDSRRSPLPVDNSMQGLDMKIHAPLSNALDDNKANMSTMGKAVAHLRRDLDRDMM